MSNIKLCRHAFLGAALLAVGTGTSATAADIPGAMTIRAKVSASCSIDSVDALDFGTLVTVGTNVTSDRDAQANLRLTCSNGTDWTVHADDGVHGDNSQRRVANITGTEFVNYNLALDAAQSTPMPTSAAGAEGSLASGTGTDIQQTFSIYGRIPSGQTIPLADLYSDQVVFTVSF